jgi:hypothetical protein
MATNTLKGLPAGNPKPAAVHMYMRERGVVATDTLKGCLLANPKPAVTGMYKHEKKMGSWR